MGHPKGECTRIGKINDTHQRSSIESRASNKFDIKRRPWEVRWYFGTVQRQEGFRYKQDAESHRAALELAVLHRETLNASTGQPLWWDVQNPMFSDWVKGHEARNSPHWVKTTIVSSNVDAMATGIETSAAPMPQRSAMKTNQLEPVSSLLC